MATNSTKPKTTTAKKVVRGRPNVFKKTTSKSYET